MPHIHDPSGPCVVCGIETTQRCSPCAEHGFDLFLCGREHQKLIWFAHKRVCGVNSNPFRFPPLTEEQVEEAIRRKDEQPTAGLSISAMVMDITLGPSESVPSALRTLALNIENLPRSQQSGSSAMRCLIRNLALCVTQILTARRSSTSWRKYCRAFKEDAAIYTPLFHHLLVYTTLFHLALSSFEDPQASSTNAFLPEVIEQMQKVINRTASMNEEVAADMGEVVSQLPTLSESAE